MHPHKIVQRVRDTGGLTWGGPTGEPAAGYVVNQPADSTPIPADAFYGPAGPGLVAAFLTDQADWLTHAGAHVGFWHDRANDTVVLGRVDLIDQLDTAADLGRARGQRSIWDAANRQEIALAHGDRTANA